MSEKNIMRCKNCGAWIFVTHIACPSCSKINVQTAKGVSDAETNQRGEIMVSVMKVGKRVTR